MTQTAQGNWLSDVIVVNESDDPQIAGDVQIYRNATDVGWQLEHWYIDEPHFALDGLGRRAGPGLEDKKVTVEKVEECPEGDALLRSWLLSTAQHLGSVRRERASKKRFDLGAAETAGALPDSVEGLIAYVGFMRSR